MKYVLGLDFGTSSLKQTILNENAEEYFSCSEEYFNRILPGGGLEQDPRVWYKCFVAMLQRVQAEGFDLADIRTICVSGQMRGLTLLDKAGRPLRDCIIWADTRCAPQMKEAMAAYGPEIMRVTHTRMDPGCTLPKILWLMEHEPEAWARTAVFLYPTNYITYRLTGAINMDRDNASGTCLYDIRSQEWSDELAGLFGLDMGKYPPLLNSREFIGEVTPQCAAETGLKPGTPVVAGGGDSSVETFSTGMTDNATIKLRLGSAGEMSTLLKPDQLAGKDNFFCFTFLDTEYLLVGTILRTCAQSVKWARDMFFSELEQSEKAYAIMDEKAARIPAGSEGVMFHPYLLGENSPYYNTGLRAMFHGLSVNHGRDHAFRAVYEGLSLSFRNAMEGDGLYDSFEKAVVVGGGAKSRLWLSILVDVLGKPLVLPQYCSVAYGAALLAGECAGLWKCEEVHAKNAEANLILHPNMESHRLYNEIFPQYKKTADASLDLIAHTV